METTLLNKTLTNNFPQDQGQFFTATVTAGGIALCSTSTDRAYLYESEEHISATGQWRIEEDYRGESQKSEDNPVAKISQTCDKGLLLEFDLRFHDFFSRPTTTGSIKPKVSTHYLAGEHPVNGDTTAKAPEHYDNSNGSLYKFCEEQGLNAYEFDILKRVVRCRKKGQFREDLEKTKFLIDLYLNEYKK